MIYETVTQFVGDPAGLRQLVTNGKTAESTHLTTEQIRTDGGTQARATLNQEKVEEYRQDLENNDGQWPFPPLTVYYDGTDHWLSDGFHRKAAAVAYGLVVVPCEVRQGTLRDAVLAACGANRTHGLSRTAEDKRRAVARMLQDEEWGKWGDREIARHCGVSPTFVGKIRDTMPTVHVDSRERLYTRNGQTQTMNTAEIGQRASRLSIMECGNCGKSQAARLVDGSYECQVCHSTWPDGRAFMTAHHQWWARQNSKTAVSAPNQTGGNDALPATTWLLQTTMAGWFIPDWSAQDRLNFVNTALRGPGPARDDLKTRIKHLNYREDDVTTALENLKEIYEGQISARRRGEQQVQKMVHTEWLDEQLEAIDDEVAEMLREDDKGETAEAESQPGKPLIEAFAAKETMSLEDSAEKVAEALEADNPKVWYALLSKIRKYPFSSDLSTWQIRVYIAKFLLGNTMGDIAAMPDKLAEWGIEVKTI